MSYTYRNDTKMNDTTIGTIVYKNYTNLNYKSL